MKKLFIRKILSVVLTLTMIFTFILPVSATSPQRYHIEEIANGHMYIGETDTKLVAIGTNIPDHIITVSIKYESNPNLTYQFIIDDYPLEMFDADNHDCWQDIIVYAENNLNEAEQIVFTNETIDPNTPMIISSAGADLANDLQSIVGSEYSDRYANQSRTMGGNTYRLYETLEYNIRNVTRVSWNAGITMATLVVSILGYAATTSTVAIVAEVLGWTISAVDALIPAGRLNQYECMAFYTRYVTVDYGTRQYAHAYKIRNFDGYEDADDNSTGRANIIPASELVYYSGTQTAEYYNGGLFTEAYNAYNNIGV